MKSFGQSTRLALLACCTIAPAAAFQIPAWNTNEKSPVNTKNGPGVDRIAFIQTIGAVASAVVLAPQQSAAIDVGGKIRFGDESLMSQKAHGTSEKPVQSELQYGVSNKLADKICNYNR